MLVPVIMAGGVGSRLWPASREAYPKQFLNFGNSADGSDPSLFQQSLQRLIGLPGLAAPIVVCNSEHRFLVAEQLRQLCIAGATIILEPVGRNTAPAVALAALAARGREATAGLLVLAADHVIADVGAFQQAILTAQAAAERGALVTFGIVPTHPETGYGYIKRGAAGPELATSPATATLSSSSLSKNAKNPATLYRVERFVEKPDLQTAQNYLESGAYYWNSGMFVFQAARYLQELESFEPEILRACTRAWQAATPDLDFTRVAPELFAACPSKSIDYAVMEKTTGAVVVPLCAGWSDLGAWSSVWEHVPRDSNGNACRGDVLLHEAKSSFVQAESRLVALVGVENTVVVETADAVLVASKDRVQEVKEIVRRLGELKRPETILHKKVYRPWGSYEGLAEDAGFQVKRIIVNPGAALSLQLHHKRAEHWVVVQGVATVTCGDRKFELYENQSTYIPLETAHRLQNCTAQPLVLIEIQCGTYLGEDDIVRLEDVYGR